LPVAQSMNAVAPLPTRNCCSVCCIWLVQHLSSSLYDCAVCFVALRIRRCSQHSVAMVRQFVHWLLLHTPTTSLGLARTIYIRFIYGIFGRKITVYTVIYGAYIRFWPTLCMLCSVASERRKFDLWKLMLSKITTLLEGEDLKRLQANSLNLIPLMFPSTVNAECCPKRLIAMIVETLSGTRHQGAAYLTRP